MSCIRSPTVAASAITNRSSGNAITISCVDPAAEVARRRAQEYAEEHREKRRADRNHQGDARAVHQAQQLVPAERVGGAEREEDLLVLAGLRVVAVDRGQRPARDEVHVNALARRREDRVRPVSEPPLGERRSRKRGEDQEQDNDAARDRDLVLPEPDPDLLPVAAGANRLELAELAAALERNLGRQPGTCGQDFSTFFSLRHSRLRA
jgi:hypothetical protein